MKTILAGVLFLFACASSALASSLTVATGQQVTISVAVTPPNVTLPLTYQWYKNAVAMVGATSSTLILPTCSVNDNATYTVKASNSSGSAVSDGAVLTVTPPAGVAPTGGTTSMAVTQPGS